jgi:hypothetical protein
MRGSLGEQEINSVKVFKNKKFERVRSVFLHKYSPMKNEKHFTDVKHVQQHLSEKLQATAVAKAAMTFQYGGYFAISMLSLNT